MTTTQVASTPSTNGVASRKIKNSDIHAFGDEVASPALFSGEDALLVYSQAHQKLIEQLAFYEAKVVEIKKVLGVTSAQVTTRQAFVPNFTSPTTTAGPVARGRKANMAPAIAKKPTTGARRGRPSGSSGGKLQAAIREVLGGGVSMNAREIQEVLTERGSMPRDAKLVTKALGGLSNGKNPWLSKSGSRGEFSYMLTR